MKLCATCVLLLSACASAQPPAGDALRASDIIARVRDATGFAALARQPQGIRIAGEGKFLGMAATSEMLLYPDGRFRRGLTADVGMDFGFDGKNVWRTDLSGETTALVFDERRESLLQAWAISGYWVEKADTLSPTINTELATDQVVALNVSMDSGKTTGRVEIDRATWLPRTWVIGEGKDETTTTLSEYREHAGVRIATSVKIANAHNVEFNGSGATIGPAPIFIADPTALRAGVPAGATWDSSIPADLEVVRAPTGHLLVHPRVDGKDVGWFILDTGAGMTVLASADVAQQQWKTFGQVAATGVGGATPASFCRPPSISLGPVTMSQPLTVVLDLAFLDGHMGRHIAGVIGYGLFARTVATIDLKEGRASLHDPASFKLEGADWSPMFVSGRVPCVPGTFEGHKGIFRLDTGAGAGTVTFHAPTVERLKLLDGRDTSPSMLGGVGGMVPARAGTITRFEIGGHTHEQVPVTFATKAEGAFADEDTDGNLGGKLFEPFVLVFDYPHERIAFVKRAAKE